MKPEKIPVYIQAKDGKLTCICLQAKKNCDRHCERDMVEWDRLRSWGSTMKRNRYGKGVDA